MKEVDCGSAGARLAPAVRLASIDGAIVIAGSGNSAYRRCTI